VDFGDFFGGGGGGYGGVGGVGFNMEDLFSAFFGGVSGGRGRGSRLEGRDMVIQMQITLEEAAAGVEKELVLDRLAPCDVCGGSGAGPEGRVITCPECHGTGQRVTTRQTFIGVMQTAVACERCGQTGHIVEGACEECEGSGRVPDRQRVTVKVPAGIDDGQQLRIAGMGEAGVRGARAGDLIVTVRVTPDEFIHREGDELHCAARISLTQAALGAELKVCGVLSEENEVHVAAGTKHGTAVRVRGRGMPRVRGGGRGDLIVHIDIDVPRKLTKKQRELLEQLSTELGDAKRAERNPLQKLKEWLTG
jgi:molecular chaperone DnaJ